MSSKNLPKRVLSLVIFAMLFSLVNIVSIPKTQAADFTIKETRITSISSSKGQPSIYSNTIVWYDERNGNSDIYAYDLKTKKEYAITSTPEYEALPTQNINTIAWISRAVENEFTDKVFAYDKDKKTTSLIPNVNPGAYSGAIEISGNKLLYVTGNSVGNPQYVRIVDTTSNVITDIPQTNNFPQESRIDGNIISMASSVVEYYDMATKTLVNVKPRSDTIGRYRSNISGTNLIWLENIRTHTTNPSRCGEHYKGYTDEDKLDKVIPSCNLILYNIVSKKETIIKSDAKITSHPDIYGNKIIWAERRYGNNDIFLYDINLEKEYRITTNPSDQYSPQIYENKIIYTDERNGSWRTYQDIYLAELTYPTAKPVAKPAPKPKPAPVVVKPTLTLSSLTKLSGSKTPPQVITTSATITPVLRTNQSFTFSGTTSANAKITLIIQSDPITTEVTADKDGNWTYLLNPKTLNLSPGSHTITAYATDSTGVKSDTIELTKFTLKSPIETPKPISPEPYNYFSIINIVSAILILAALAFLFFRILKKRASNQPTATPQEGI